MITYEKLRDKFIDKGYTANFYSMILKPLPFEHGKLIGSLEEQRKMHNKLIQEVYGEEWDYWNTWIDYQNYK